MTKNQIAFAQLQEDIRHNRAVETETQRNNLTVSGETQRHNIVTEAQTGQHYTDQAKYWFDANAINQAHYERMDSETQRHNIATEDINWFNAYENQRHNQQSEAIGWTQTAETARHNRETESQTWVNIGETISHNAATEYIAWVNSNIAQQNADSNTVQSWASLQNAQTNQKKADSEISLNQIRGEDIQNQITNRNINTGLNVIGTGAEAWNDYTRGVNNIVNSLDTAVGIVLDPILEAIS